MQERIHEEYQNIIREMREEHEEEIRRRQEEYQNNIRAVLQQQQDVIRELIEQQQNVITGMIRQHENNIAALMRTQETTQQQIGEVRREIEEIRRVVVPEEPEAEVSEWGNPAADMSCHLQVNTWPAREVPGELKHLSSRRKRKQQ